MAKTKKKNPARAAQKAHKKNPTVRAMPKTNYKPKKRKSNPQIPALAKAPLDYLRFGFIALLGLAVSRQLPQLALAEKNEGYTGYLANLGTAVAGAFAAGRFAGPAAAIAFGTGGGLYAVNRFLTDKFTPVGRVLSLSGCGDPQASNNLGNIRPGSVYPPSYDRQGNLILPPVFKSAVKALIPAGPMPAAGMSGAGRLRRGSARLAA